MAGWGGGDPVDMQPEGSPTPTLSIASGDQSLWLRLGCGTGSGYWPHVRGGKSQHSCFAKEGVRIRHLPAPHMEAQGGPSHRRPPDDRPCRKARCRTARADGMHGVHVCGRCAHLEENVGWREVAVADALLMHVAHASADVAEDTHDRPPALRQVVCSEVAP